MFRWPDRVLPLLKNHGFHPTTVNFATYTKEQLVAILSHRLRGLFGAGGSF
jgi:Cdc6-like AAA superfamily ATPase